jgi:hypothetical protein
MRRPRSSARRLVPLIVVVTAAVIVGAACQPAKKAAPPPAPGTFIAYYWGSGAETFRSAQPSVHDVGGGTITHALMPDGAVELTTSGQPPPVDVGFWTVPVRLGDLQSVVVNLTANSAQVLRVDLFVDVDGDGDFFEWDANGNWVGYGDDHWLLGPTSPTLGITVDGSTVFGTHTLDELKAGTVGIGPATPVAISVAIMTDAPNELAVMSSMLVNGLDILVP